MLTLLCVSRLKLGWCCLPFICLWSGCLWHIVLHPCCLVMLATAAKWLTFVSTRMLRVQVQPVWRYMLKSSYWAQETRCESCMAYTSQSRQTLISVRHKPSSMLHFASHVCPLCAPATLVCCNSWASPHVCNNPCLYEVIQCIFSINLMMIGQWYKTNPHYCWLILHPAKTKALPHEEGIGSWGCSGHLNASSRMMILWSATVHTPSINNATGYKQ